VKSQYSISIEQLNEFSLTFDHFDEDASNSIDRNEFRAVMRALGEDLEDQKCGMMNQNNLVSCVVMACRSSV